LFADELHRTALAASDVHERGSTQHPGREAEPAHFAHWWGDHEIRGTALELPTQAADNGRVDSGTSPDNDCRSTLPMCGHRGVPYIAHDRDLVAYEREPIATARQAGGNGLETHPRIATHPSNEIEHFLFATDDDDPIETAT